MADPNIIPGDVRIGGNLAVKSLNIQDASVEDDDVKNDAGISASKLEHQHALSYRQKTGTAIVAATEDIHIVRGATGSIVSVKVACTTPPTGDHAFTVDVKVAKQGESFTTQLTGVVTVDNAAAAQQLYSGTLIASPALEVGDIIRVVVAVSGSTSSQGAGLVVTITTREDAD